MDKKQHTEEFGLENVFADNYLGSPAVVTKVVQDYIDKLYGIIKGRGDGSVSRKDFEANVRKWATEFADIFMGRNPDYVKVAGWNSRFALGIAIKQELGDEFWEKHRSEYHDDPGEVMFGWLAAILVRSCNESLKDPDAAGERFNDKKQKVIRFLLGIDRRK